MDAPDLKAALGPCREPLSFRFLGREDFRGLLSRQGVREDGSKGAIEAAYLDRYGKGDPRFGVIGAFWEEELLGATSFGVIENRNILAHTGDTDGRRFWYGRIDAAVVPLEYRGYGVGRWLLEANLLYMLRTWPGDLYSLSTIAAHKAVAYVLSQLGFRVEAKEGMTEEKVSIDIDGGNEGELGEALMKKVEKSGSLVFFRIRQRGGL